MAITVSCPACERELKVKDELAGRKVRCPKCGQGVVVPGDDEDEEKAAATPPPRKASRQEEDEEERPRKKKKKKQKNNNVLILSAVGGLLLVGVVVVVIVLNLPKKEPPPQVQKPAPVPEEFVQAKPAEKEEPKGRVGAGARAAADQQIIQNDLKQLGIFWNQWRTEHNGRPPKDWDTFKPYLRTAGGIVQGIEEGRYKLVLNAQPASNAVLAYEWPQDSTFQHIVVMGDGSVDRLLHQELLDKVPNAGK